MKLFPLLLLALSSLTSFAAEVTCTHNDIYGFLGEFDVNTASLAFEVTLPSDVVEVPDLRESGLVSLKGKFEECSTAPADPILLRCHLERSGVTVTRPDGSSFVTGMVINLRVDEITVRSAGGSSVSHVGFLGLSSGEFALKNDLRIDFGNPTNPPGRKADYCVAR